MIGKLVRWLRLQPPTTVLVYVSMPGEIPAEMVVPDCSDVHSFATTRTPERGPLTIHDFVGPRERHRLGYEQPFSDAAVVESASVGIVLVPGLVFSLAGDRLGWGKGYYDQLLASLGGTFVGVTLERRVVPDVPAESHDVAMDMLVTEARMSSAVQEPVADQ